MYVYKIISRRFLEVATERETDGDLILRDIGQGLPFKAGAFDGAVSISALQWLCYANKASHNPTKSIILILLIIVCVPVEKRKSSVTILSREQ